MKVTEQYVFFWNGIYSQWHKAKMVIGGIEYNSCEQYMMHMKAILFNDLEIAEQIMQEKNPREQKRLGRLIKNFDKATWDKNCFAIVYKGNLNKFYQNEDLKKELLSTGDKFLVEASPLDNIWGIGMTEEDPTITNPINWKGLNLLGTAITLVKHKLK